MEFPHLGKHCNESTCNRLDFLPMKCDACDKIFCSTHFNYEKHKCAGAHKKNVQVPVCPLCGEPVPTAPGVAPDLTVGQHIDRQCKSDSKKIYTNRCNFKGCKRKELVPVTCTQCQRNFCLKHRHTNDHECTTTTTTAATNSLQKVFKTSNGFVDQKTLAANAAEYRRTNKPTTLFNAKPKANIVTAATIQQQPQQQRASSNATATARATANSATQHIQQVQGDMTEDEAFARALALSIMELDEVNDRNRRNQAAATAMSRTVSVGAQNGNAKDRCSLS